jgi:hypothetical protein
MTTKNSAATGNYNTAGTWSPSGVPTYDDDVHVKVGHTVTVDAASLACNTMTVENGGALDLDYDFYVKTSMNIYANASLTHNGTQTAPRTIFKYGTSPTYWFLLLRKETKQTRTVNARYLRLSGAATLIGNEDAYLLFNTGANSTPALPGISLPAKDATYNEHEIPGRTQSRRYKRGHGATVVECSGSSPRTSFYADALETMKESESAICLTSEWAILERCDIERSSYPAGDGLFHNINLTLVGRGH